MIEVKIKRLNENAVIPSYAKDGDAGMDLTATSRWYDENGNVCYGTGIAIEIPEGYVGLVYPRSSICKFDLSLSNAVGVIDSGYRGEIMAKFKPSLAFFDYLDSENKDNNQVFDYVEACAAPNDCAFPATHYDIGDRIAQIIIMPYPKIQFIESDELSDTERGVGGYGHSGK